MESNSSALGLDGQSSGQPAAVADGVVSTAINNSARSVSSGGSRRDVSLEVVGRIREAQNVLIALSKDPSVDEMAAAIGLSIYLSKIEKRVAAIYSGTTPNALEFLKPEETFDSSTDTLQDFVIALNKDKADHLRYKLDGDYVKIFITPYKTRIDERDLEFSYGDYNVDLVLALDVMNGADLDSALREHGRIMHDAPIINITTGNPGKFGEIEWSDKTASSISEMIAELIFDNAKKSKMEKEEATAFLTGIVAATNRFSNAKTTPRTMQVASQLMNSGANQQLVSKNITPEVENELYAVAEKKNEAIEGDPTKLSINHGEESNSIGVAENEDADPKEEIHSENETSELLNDLKAAEESLAQAGNEVVPDVIDKPVRIESGQPDLTESREYVGGGMGGSNTMDGKETVAVSSFGEQPSLENGVNSVQIGGADASQGTQTALGFEPVLPQVVGAEKANDKLETDEAINLGGVSNGVVGVDYGQSEKVVQPPEEMGVGTPGEDTSKYGKMLEDAIGESNPAAAMAPQVAAAPEINGTPVVNYAPLPDQEILPPPPAPPIDMAKPNLGPVGVDGGESLSEALTVAPVQQLPTSDSGMQASVTTPTSSVPNSEPVSLGGQPAMQDQVYVPQASDPGAFKIPGT